MNVRDVPDALMRRVRIAATIHRKTIRDFVIEALERAVWNVELPPAPQTRKPRR